MDEGDYILKADGTRVPVAPENGRATYKLAQLKAIVGGYIELVSLSRESPAKWMVVNEDGLRLGLPRNEAATALYRGNTRPNDNPIVGDVLVCGRGRIE